MNKIKIISMLIIINVFYGCPSLPSIGVQSIGNSKNILMVDLYDVLLINFGDYNVELKTKAESRSFGIYPVWGEIITKAHYYIIMDSENISIIIQYGIDVYGELTDMYINYYLKIKNAYEYLNELNEPMERMKICLLNNFSNIINEENIIQSFKAEPYR